MAIIVKKMTVKGLLMFLSDEPKGFALKYEMNFILDGILITYFTKSKFFFNIITSQTVGR